MKHCKAPYNTNNTNYLLISMRHTYKHCFLPKRIVESELLNISEVGV